MQRRAHRRSVRISRRVFLHWSGIALSALPFGPTLPCAQRTVLSLHMDRPLITSDESGEPYEPQGIRGGAIALAALSEAELRAYHPYL
jgi:hypothetical protein